MLSGKTEVDHVVDPIVACTRTEPKPRGGRGRSRMRADSCAGTVTKNQAPCASQRQSSAVKRHVLMAPA